MCVCVGGYMCVCVRKMQKRDGCLEKMYTRGEQSVQNKTWGKVTSNGEFCQSFKNYVTRYTVESYLQLLRVGQP